MKQAHVGLPAVVVALGLCAGCGGDSGLASRTFTIGSKVQVGPLIYTVVETSWQTDLSTDQGPRIPKNRFLVMRISITNSGGADAAVPLLTLKTQKGEDHLELSDVVGVPNWLGLLRRIAPGDTELGAIVFDVPMAPYLLEVSDGGPPGEERTSLIEIPLQYSPQGPPPESLAPKPELKK